MSKYDEVTALAQTYVQGYFRRRDEARSDVALLISRFLEFMGIPQSKLRFVQVDATFKPVGSPTDHWTAVNMQDMGDGYWGCGIVVEYSAHPRDGYLLETTKVSVKRDGERRIVRFGFDGRVHQIEGELKEAFNVVLQEWYETTKTSIERGHSGPSRAIGFIEPT